jgi:hypothetical protein
MADGHELRWKIDGKYTAETMPLARLAEYLRELATMLGESKGLHLLKVETSSAVPILRLDTPSYEQVTRRAFEARGHCAGCRYAEL